MNIALVVASGAHQGKQIPMLGAQFVIGRDEGCNLRPASPAISKKHCAILVKTGRVYIKDLGSTNGTFVNDNVITEEQELLPGDRVKVGPLEFTLQLTGRSDSTPLPDQLKSVDNTASSKLAEAAGTKPPSSSGSVPAPKPSATTKPAATPKPTPGPSKPIPKPSATDDAAAMLLGLDDDEPITDSKVPEGSTVMEIPAVDASKKPDPKKTATQAESSSAADELLRKYLRRPK
jgi:pSer/pThr/pTyr-binding forkhead associated (FHA) protein